MHAYLITGGTQEKRIKKIDSLIASFHASQFSLRFLTLPDDSLSISVDLVREWTRSLSFSGAKNSPLIGIIRDAHLMTGEAQTALLKTLEEPPGEVKILIETASDGSILPTILSRTVKYFLGTSASDTGEICPASIGEVLGKAQENGKTKESARIYLTAVIESIHEKWIGNPDQKSASYLKNCVNAFRMISVNVSPFSVIETALLPQ